MKDVKNGEKVAIPGELIATTEEYSVPPFYEGTIEEKEGRIYSSKLGLIEVDAARRTISVKPTKVVRLLRAGDAVMARVENIYSSIALVKIERVVEPVRQRIVFGTASAFLRISELGFYAEEFRDAVKIGDVVRARVIEVSPLATYVTLASDDLGVVKAFCSKCRRELKQVNGELVCEACGSRERRKLVGAGIPPGGEPRRRLGSGLGRERAFEGRREMGERHFPSRRFSEGGWTRRTRREEREERGRYEARSRLRRKKIYGPRISKNY